VKPEASACSKGYHKDSQNMIHRAIIFIQSIAVQFRTETYIFAATAEIFSKVTVTNIINAKWSTIINDYIHYKPVATGHSQRAKWTCRERHPF